MWANGNKDSLTLDEEGYPVPKTHKEPIKFDSDGLPIPIKKKEDGLLSTFSKAAKLVSKTGSTVPSPTTSKLPSEIEEKTGFEDAITETEQEKKLRETVKPEGDDFDVNDPVKSISNRIASKTARFEQPKAESVKQDNLSAQTKGLLQKESNLTPYLAAQAIKNIKETTFPTAASAREWYYRDGKVPDEKNETDVLARDVINKYEKVKSVIANNGGDLTKSAIALYSDENPQLKLLKDKGVEPPPIVQSNLKYQLLQDKNVQELANENQEFKNIYQAEKISFMRNNPEFHVNHIVSKIAQGREDYGYNNPFLNLVGVNSSDKVIENLAMRGEIDEEDKDFYYKAVRPLLEIHAKEIPTTGLIENAFKSATTGISDLPKGIAELTGANQLYTTKAERTYGNLDEDYNAVAVTPKTFVNEVAQATGSLIGVIAPIPSGAKVLQLTNIIKNAGTANNVMMGLTFYHSFYKESETNNPGQPLENQLSAILKSAIFMKINPAFKQLSGAVIKDAAPKIDAVLNRLKTGEISVAAAKENIIKDVLNKGIQVTKKSLDVSTQMAIATGLNDVVDGVFTGKFDADKAIGKAVDTFEHLMLATPGLHLFTVPGNSRKVIGQTIYKLTENPERTKESINEQAQLDPDFQKYAPELLKNFDHAVEVRKELDVMDLNQQQKEKFIAAETHKKILETKIENSPSKVLNSREEKQIAALEIEQQMIVDPEMGNKKFMEEMYDEDLLPTQDRVLLENNETKKFEPQKVGAYLKYIAQQANGLTEDWKPASDGKKPNMDKYPPQIIEAANERWAKEIEAAQPKEEVATKEEISEPIELNPELPKDYILTEKVEVETEVNLPDQQKRLENEKPIIETSSEKVEPISPKEESGTMGQAKEGEQGAAKEPPKPPAERVGEGDGGEGRKELDKLANNIPDSGRVAEYMSKDTIEKYTGETPANDQSRGVQELDIALNHGEKIIEKAKELFGKDYAEKTLEYIEQSTAGVSNKALMYVSLENALGREKLQEPTREAEITKQQALVYEQSQKFARENSLALNYQKLRKIAKAGYDIEKVTDNFFSADELAGKKEISKAIESDPDAINKEAELQEKGGMTPEIEKAIEAGVEKEIAKIYEALPKSRQSAADKAIRALEAVQKKLRSRTYDAGLGVPVAFIDAGITVIKHALKVGVKIADAVELGINKIKEKYGKKWENEDKFRKDMLEEYGKVISVDTKQLVKDALIEKGFGREITVKGEKKQILDWKKLAGAAGTVTKISENVAEILKDKGYKLKDIEAIKDELIQEYIDVRTGLIEKAQNELARRNKETITPEQKSAAKKLSELYTYGLFEKEADTFENTLNKALGAKVSEQGFNEAKEIAKGLETIYTQTFKGVRLNDVSAKAAIEKLEDKLRILLFREAKQQGNFNLKAANIVRTYFEIQQTMLLNNLKQAVENPFSGLQQNAIDALDAVVKGESNPELRGQRRTAMKNIYKDMVLNGGITYGKVESQFVNRQHLDDHVNKLSDNKLYHGVMSVFTGKSTLNAMDAMFKASITEKKFAGNLITILTHKTNPKRMGKEEAMKFVTEKLTGQTYKDAQVTAKEVIEKINADAKTELIPTNETQVNRLANDIVKASLEMGNKISKEEIQAAYNAAYKAGGLGLGHEANNMLSSTIKGYSAKLEGDINRAIKDKEWNRAAALTYKSVLFRNVLNPFVGGGTNWLVLKLEKTGLGLFTGLAYKIGSKSSIDLSTELGQKRLEDRLYNQARWKDNFMRGLVGGIVTGFSYLAFTQVAQTDEYRKWRAKNRWASRILDVFTPEPILTRMAIRDKKVKQYVANSFNRNDAFSGTQKLVKSAEYFSKGDSKKGWGALGESVGMKFNAPIPWRLVKDGQVIYQGVTGEDPWHGDYRPSEGFASGLLQGGVVEWLGFRPVAKTEDSSRPQRPERESNRPERPVRER